MRSLQELINLEDPAFPLVQQWIAMAFRPVEVLPPSNVREKTLHETQVTTRSPMGAVAFETGGILVDSGWLRILGSGHPRLTRTLPGWNAQRSNGYYLVADDAVGGFFAINGGALGPDAGQLYYFAPDSLRWEPMGIGYSQFLQWTFSEKLDQFYDWIRWPNWKRDIESLHGDRCYSFFPFLWTVEGKGGIGRRGEIPVTEAWGLQFDMLRQMGS